MIFITPHEALEKSAAAVRQHRISQQLTQKNLALKAGVALATIRKFERTGSIALESFFKLATALGILEKIILTIEEKIEYTSLDDMIKESKKEKRVRVRASKKS